MKASNQYHPQTVSHPGETLVEKLEEMGMSIKEFAVRTAKPEKTIFAIIKGASSITPDMAVTFEDVTKIPARFWMNLQCQYDECEARNKRERQMESFLSWSRKFPFAPMAKLGWIPACKSNVEKAASLLAYFAVGSPTAWENYYLNQQLKVAFRISLSRTKEPYAISAWLRRGEIQCKELSGNQEYSEKELRDKLPEMKALMTEHPEDTASRLQALCLACGVKLVYTPCLPKAPINGSTRWINNTPCVQLSGRQKRYDVFWFSFFHEIGHILLHGKKDIFLEDIEYDDKQMEKETEADAFASRILLSPAEEKQIIDNGDYSVKAILKYAKQFKTHPSIIVGRLQYKKIIPYRNNRQLVTAINLFPGTEEGNQKPEKPHRDRTNAFPISCRTHDPIRGIG